MGGQRFAGSVWVVEIGSRLADRHDFVGMITSTGI